ncbi:MULTISPECIES: circularly permuted type 2 ATP-grasp protein [unclassified Neptuniibacter]|uniref:circularly permuted type 2 ATP-grasp protein n=1 Tax=unclassified Neptuniibacter TaxID=2630693 RepID=UPI0026E30BCC|nr:MULTISPECIES: circularly permuted type 2 ATP-grasp protein [unclassified Neptuniibacter]MDO6513521.1 circularly permuted type 2 ATP-grasp protein [Neptuniibacter sp. 2_MG-2023]MDO6593667.1 circularly permuted type 2 ATP-grasp protein [Neptuniibacter sp. 1_MG-2023]
MGMIWDNYQSKQHYDELITPTGRARDSANKLVKHISEMDEKDLDRRRQMAEVTIQEMGISFTVYTEEGNIDRAWPFDIIPRTIPAPLWKTTADGLKQRLKALNMFIDDLYHDQNVIKDGIIPEHIIKESKNFRPECVGVNPAHGVWAHICGTDLVRDADGQFYVLEDNLRVPSGVSYMLENRAITKRVLPEMFEKENILPLDDYPEQLFDMLLSLSPREIEEPEIVVLTPGIFNSAYFEHAFLAQQMGVELVEGSDLFVDDDDCVYMKTISGPERVDVIYRRIDDLFIDPEVFDKESVLGVPGMMRAWKAGNVALANAPGAGVADDKVIYAYVPEIIEYYLNEKPILPNVETFLCEDPEQRAYVLEHLDELVIKPANESGGYGMLIGPHSTKKEQATFAELIQENPRNYIAQPTLSLSTAPTLISSNTMEPRHLDLRPFILQGKNTYVTTGGLTRVAMKKGSLVVNSSQGGGSKDTWIVDTEDK